MDSVNVMATIPVGYMLIEKYEYDLLKANFSRLNERMESVKDYVRSERYISEHTLKVMLDIPEEEGE